VYTLFYTKKFEKDLKLIQKRGYDLTLLETVIEALETTGKIDASYLPHKLKGNYADCMECHIKPDWLLIWSQKNSPKEIYLIRTGTHSDLF
jgi:mRNA interferase YafQ